MPGRDNPKIVTYVMAKDSGQKGGKRILLVDDDAEIVESLRLALESNGYTVLIARDGKSRPGLNALAQLRGQWLG